MKKWPEKIKEVFGSQKALAKKLKKPDGSIGISSMTISQWKERGVPAGRAKEIERLSNGKVPAYLMRPDLYEPPKEGQAA